MGVDIGEEHHSDKYRTYSTSLGTKGLVKPEKEAYNLDSLRRNGE
jgi:hypothetical protein